jgi:hypothetical protein
LRDADGDVEFDDPNDILLPFHRHLRRIERILYIFAKVNPEFSYSQGFNELCCVLFYAFDSSIAYFHNDPIEVEALIFFTFEKLLKAIGRLFTATENRTVVSRQIDIFMGKLEHHLPDVAGIIHQHSIPPIYFSFRWLNLIFCQEYSMPNLVLVWDALFAHFEELCDYANYVAVAQVKMIRDGLDAKDYVKTINTLQKSQIQDVKQLLFWADSYWVKDHKEASPWFDGVKKKVKHWFGR